MEFIVNKSINEKYFEIYSAKVNTIRLFATNIQANPFWLLSYKKILLHFAGRNNASLLKCISASIPYFYLIAKAIKFHEKHLLCPFFSKLHLCTSGHAAKVHRDDEKHSTAISHHKTAVDGTGCLIDIIIITLYDVLIKEFNW